MTETALREIALWVVVVGLGMVVVFHLYWALGGRVGTHAVIPKKPAAQGGEPLFHPSPLGTASVALFLVGVICLAVIAYGGRGIALSWSVVRVLLGLCGGVFVLRAVGEFRYIGFFKKITDSAFAYWDTRVFSPFILVIGLACLIIALHGHPI